MYSDAFRPHDRSGLAVSDRWTGAEGRRRGASNRERRRPGSGLVSKRIRRCPQISLGCGGGLEGVHSRRGSAGILGRQYGAADCLSRHPGSAETCASLDREDRSGFFLVRPLVRSLLGILLKRLAVPREARHGASVPFEQRFSDQPSRRRICWLTVDCDRCTRSAAREKLLVCATATTLGRRSGPRLFIMKPSKSLSILS